MKHSKNLTENTTAKDAEFLEQTTVDQTSSVSSLHRSNLLRLQCDELLQECTPGNKLWVSIATEYVDHVNQLIATMNNESFVPLHPAPFSTQLSDKKTVSVATVKLQTLATEEIGLTTAAGNANVLPTFRIKVVIPNAVFEPKDYLRHRYLDKRNTIVWNVASYLSQTKFAKNIGAVYWRYHRGDCRKPILILVPPIEHNATASPQKKKHKGGKEKNVQYLLKRTKTLRFRVQIYFGIESTDWMSSPLRLVPNRSNLQGTSASPFYNFTITEDAVSHQPILDDVDDFKAVWNQATVLAKVWCLQRGFLRAHDGFDTEQIALLLLYLYRTRRVNARMGATQILAALFKLLAETDWLGERIETTNSETLRVAPSEGYQAEVVADKRAVLVLPIAGKTENQTISASELARLYAQQTLESPLTEYDQPTLIELYSKQYDLGPVFLDSTLTHNYFARVSPSFMRAIQTTAQQSLACLNGEIQRPFSYLFMHQARFWARYDAYMQVSLKDISFTSSPLWGNDRVDVGDYECCSRSLVRVLRRALGDRVTAVHLLSTGNGNIKESVEAVDDSDQIATCPVGANVFNKSSKQGLLSPCGDDVIVIGFNMNPATCFRVVDRGPPADDLEATDVFLKLWGEKRAHLRRFKDGAIIHAVIWESVVEEHENCGDAPYVRFQNDDTLQGGIVERIVRHIVQLHFLGKSKQSKGSDLQFSLRDMLSLVDGVLPAVTDIESGQSNPLSAHRMAIKAFDALSDFLRKSSTPSLTLDGSGEMTSRLGLPLAIDAVEPLSPALRYSELFPSVPHPMLGSAGVSQGQKVSGAVVFAPIDVQIRFGASSKWPTDLKAMGAAKAAMLLSLVDGIEAMKQNRLGDCSGFDGPTNVTPTHVDIGFMGYVFRIRVRADPELKMLRGLSRPSDEASSLLTYLTRRHIVASAHHSMTHAVYMRHPSSSAVARLAKRWVASHLLSGHMPFEAIELLVMSIYTDTSSPVGAPGTVSAGFMRFLRLMADHDWARDPLIVDPQGHIDEDARIEIHKQFESVRGSHYQNGPPMYIVSPCDVTDDAELSKVAWFPSFTHSLPESVVLARAVLLARRTNTFLNKALKKFDKTTWPAAFHETSSSFRSYSALLRVDPSFIVDQISSSTANDLDIIHANKDGSLISLYTRSMQHFAKGPKSFQRKVYRNLVDKEADIFLDWNPLNEVIRSLQSKLGSLALFFYSEICPDVIAVLWRSPKFAPRAFSAIASQYARPVTSDEWKNDTLATVNVHDLLRVISQYTVDVVNEIKVLDYGLAVEPSRKRKTEVQADMQSTGSTSSSEEEDE